MKDLHGSARATTGAPAPECLRLLADVERYPEWYPDVVRTVEVLERDAEGGAERVRTTLHAAFGPLARDLQLTLDVVREGETVRLARVPNERSDGERFTVTWQVSASTGDGHGQGATRIDLALDASLDVPRLVPLGGAGDTLATGFVEAAVARLGRG